MEVAVCLPTYNERPNLARMLAALGEIAAASSHRISVLVIDDNSPDGTGALADELAQELPFVRVLHRPAKEGLGPAYVAGFRRALLADADLIVEMDCDFSHDPRDLPRLVEAAQAADVVLGSRYVDGGRVVNWGWSRRAISNGGCFYARRILGVSVFDLTGGFKCFRREVLEAFDLDAIVSRGYAFQIELTYWAIAAGFRVLEVPITFSERAEGTSKMTARIALEAALQVPAIRLRARRARARQAPVERRRPPLNV
ncbi:MAG: polyprenol monophosphomannose synthase [Gaiellaceae bacterium]